MYQVKFAACLGLAFVLAVIVSRRNEEPEPNAPERGDAVATETNQLDAPGSSGGLVSASWRVGTPHDEEPAVVSHTTEAEPDADQPEWAGIPEEVRERLAREYVGMDIAIARPPQHRKGQVGE